MTLATDRNDCKYRQAMDMIHVTPDMKAAIERRLDQQAGHREVSVFRFRWKPVLQLGCCAAALLVAVVLIWKPIGMDREATAVNEAPMDGQLLTGTADYVPQGYELVSSRQDDGCTEVVYACAADTLTFDTYDDLGRMPALTAAATTLQVGQLTVSLVGTSDAYTAAYWQDGQYGYVLTSTAGLSEAAIGTFVASAG